MAKIRSKYWVPTLKQLVKRVLRICYGCKKFDVKSYTVPQKGLLPADRTNLDLPFKTIRLCRVLLVQVRREEGKKCVCFTVDL